jgi:hypothetical protein
MTFRKFIEYGTQGAGPGASGARGAPAISGDVSQKGPPQSKPAKAGDVTQQAKDNSGIKGSKIPPGPMSPRGLGAPMQPPKVGFSGSGGKWKAMEFSPMSLGTKWKTPEFSPFSSKNKWAPRTANKN